MRKCFSSEAKHSTVNKCGKHVTRPTRVEIRQMNEHTTDRGKGLTVTLARTLCSMPSAGQLSAACVSSPRGVGTPARLAHEADCHCHNYLWCNSPSTSPPTQSTKRDRSRTTRAKERLKKKNLLIAIVHVSPPLLSGQNLGTHRLDLLSQVFHGERLGCDISGIHVARHASDGE